MNCVIAVGWIAFGVAVAAAFVTTGKTGSVPTAGVLPVLLVLIGGVLHVRDRYWPRQQQDRYRY